MNPLIIKNTAADSGSFYFQVKHIGCALQVDGDLGSDTITVKYRNAAGDLTTATDCDREPLVLSADVPAIPIYFSCWITATKGVTTNAVGVNIAGMD